MAGDSSALFAASPLIGALGGATAGVASAAGYLLQFSVWLLSSSLTERLRNAGRKELLVSRKALRLGLGSAKWLARLGCHGNLRLLATWRRRGVAAKSWAWCIRCLFSTSLCTAGRSLLGQRRAPQVALGREMTATPNPIEGMPKRLRLFCAPLLCTPHANRWTSHGFI